MSDTPSISSKRPVPAIGLRRKQRVSGEAYLVGVVDEPITLMPGTTLDLRKMHGGNLETPEYVLLIVPPPRAVALTKAERADAAADRRDASLLRQDPRDDGQEMP